MHTAPCQEELFCHEGRAEWQPLLESCRYLQGFLPKSEASDWLHQLHAELPWKRQAIRLFGKEVMQPRLTCWQADPGVDYGYSGIRLVPGTWHPLLVTLRRRLQSELGLDFNAVLANAYRDSSDSMGWHADDEPELGPEPILASISLGAERMFRWRHQRSGQSGGARLQHGSLLVLDGKFQRDYQHSVPKTRAASGLRINLTFRQVFTVQKGGV